MSLPPCSTTLLLPYRRARREGDVPCRPVVLPHRGSRRSNGTKHVREERSVMGGAVSRGVQVLGAVFLVAASACAGDGRSGPPTPEGLGEAWVNAFKEVCGDQPDCPENPEKTRRNGAEAFESIARWCNGDPEDIQRDVEIEGRLTKASAEYMCPEKLRD